MPKALFAIAGVLALLGPFAAQGAGHSFSSDAYDEVLFQNVCAPELELYDIGPSIALDEEQSAKLRIELLERGFDPGFDSEAVDAETKLTEAIQMFQADFLLPITGQPDLATLFILGVEERTNGS
jgi:hypothetical protein